MFGKLRHFLALTSAVLALLIQIAAPAVHALHVQSHEVDSQGIDHKNQVEIESIAHEHDHHEDHSPAESSHHSKHNCKLCDLLRAAPAELLNSEPVLVLSDTPARPRFEPDPRPHLSIHRPSVRERGPPELG